MSERIAGAVLLVLGIIGLWIMDVAAIHIQTGQVLSNGFWTTDPAQGFHVGLFLTFVALAGMYYFWIRK